MSAEATTDGSGEPPATVRAASWLDACIAIGGTMALLAFSVVLYGTDSSQGANQIALAAGAVLAAALGIRNGHRWGDIERGIVNGIAIAMPAVLILLSVGSLIGIWMLSGTVPTLISYGLRVLDPAIFYPACCLLTAMAALAIGSSWTVAGTLGVALIGVATALGASVEITAGAVVSGAYFGDKLSPLSDTTNLAPAVAGTDLFAHIRHMLWTTVPSLAIALAGFAIVGIIVPAASGTARLDATLTALEQGFNIGPAMLLPVLVVMLLALRRAPALGAILAGIAAGIACAIIFQGDAILRYVAAGQTLPDPTATTVVRGIWTTLFAGHEATTGMQDVDALLSRGGMGSMLNTVWLIIAAMTFGAVLEITGMLQTVLAGLQRLVGNSTGGLVSATLSTSIGVNVLAADQYMAIVLPGRMFRGAYARLGLDPKYLSRALEDAGTLTSPLVPWNTCGAYMSAALGVSTLAYLPWCFFNLASPLISALLAWTGFRMAAVKPADRYRHAPGRDAR